MKPLALLPVLLAAGCIIGGESSRGNGDESGGPEPGDGEIQPVPTNGLVLDAALAAQLPTGPLASAPDAFDSTAGRALLKYAAICALPSEATLTVGGASYRGYYGLAPEWETGTCGESCQRWVTACLLAHANANGTPVEISLRGEHPALRAAPDAVAAFTEQEAAFYGNAFAGQLLACVGGASATSPTADAAKLFLEGRVCGQLYGDCGIVSTGFCEQSSVIAACKQVAPTGGGFADCHIDEMLGDIGGLERTSPVIHEVVTVYLKP